jgi:Pyridoxamine 5'-phosphate oxidase
MPVGWDDEIESVLDGDPTAALAYRTPAGGAVVQAVAPIGLHDRAAGTVGFTTSYGFSKKLDRIAADARVALAFHAREYGTATSSAYVLVQGRARIVRDDAAIALMRRLAVERLGAPYRGRFWDFWLREYTAARVPVYVDVERVVAWPDLRCAGAPRVLGAAPLGPADAQSPPRKGTAPRIDVERAARRLRGNAHVLLGYAGADGFPVVTPVTLERDGPDGIVLAAAAPLPPGGRRAGLTAHSYRPRLVGLETRQHTGWLEVGADGRGLYAPHTEVGYVAPPNKALLLLLNGALAKRGVRQARRAGSLPAP